MDKFTQFTIGAAALMGGIGLIIFGCMLYSLPVYLLWNWVMPIFGLPNLNLILSESVQPPSFAYEVSSLLMPGLN